MATFKAVIAIHFSSAAAPAVSPSATPSAFACHDHACRSQRKRPRGKWRQVFLAPHTPSAHTANNPNATRPLLAQPTYTTAAKPKQASTSSAPPQHDGHRRHRQHRAPGMAAEHRRRAQTDADEQEALDPFRAQARHHRQLHQLLGPPVPNSMPCSMSRTKPAIRDSRVIALNTALERNRPLIGATRGRAGRIRGC